MSGGTRPGSMAGPRPRSAEEIRKGRAWLDVHDTERKDGWLIRLWTREGDNLTARYGLQSSQFNKKADVPELAVANARVLGIPAVYGNAVLYDPPDDAAREAEAVRPWQELVMDVDLALELNPNQDHLRGESKNAPMAQYVKRHGLEAEVKNQLARWNIAEFQAETRVARAHIQLRARALLGSTAKEVPNARD